MHAKLLLITGLLGFNVMLTACGGGSGGVAAVDPSNQQSALLPATTTVDAALCEGQNGSVDVPRAPGVVTGRPLPVSDLATLKGDYCKNSTGRHQIRSGGSAYTITQYTSCSLKVEESGRLTLKAGDKTFSALVDGSSRDRVVGGAVSAQDPSLTAGYMVSAVDETGPSPIEHVDVIIHRRRVVQVSGARPNVSAGPLNDEQLVCIFLNPTRVGSLAQTNLVGGYATASDLASTLVTQVQGTVTAIVSGQVAKRACSIGIDESGIMTINSPEVINGEFTGGSAVTTAKLDGNAYDSTVLQNGKVSISAATGNQQLTLIVDQSTQRIELGLGSGNGGLCQTVP